MPEIMTDVRTSANEQLVVDVPHLELVTGRLAQLNAPPIHSAVDHALGLALLRLPSGTDVNALAPDLRSADDLNVIPVIGTNPYLTVTPGVIHPYPQPKPHGLSFLAAADQAPTPRGDGVVKVGVLDPRPAGPIQAGESISLLAAGHTAFATALIHDQAPNAAVAVQGVLDDDGMISAWTVMRGMMALAAAGVHVIYLSVGCTDDEAPLPLQRAVDMLSRDVLLVAAAGDQNRTTWPAALDGVVAVGARQDDGTLSDFSPRQPWVRCTAPGDRDTSLTATVPPVAGIQQEFTGGAIWSGTAFAAATASGVIAARTVPGTVTAHDALAALLAEDGGVVRKYVPGDDGQRA